MRKLEEHNADIEARQLRVEQLHGSEEALAAARDESQQLQNVIAKSTEIARGLESETFELRKAYATTQAEKSSLDEEAASLSTRLAGLRQDAAELETVTADLDRTKSELIQAVDQKEVGREAAGGTAGGERATQRPARIGYRRTQ